MSRILVASTICFEEDMSPVREVMVIDGRPYDLDVLRVGRARAIDVSVALVSYNGRELTRLAIDSIRRWCGDSVEIWAVDNASTDGSPEDLLERGDCNVVLNRTPSSLKDLSRLRRLFVRPGGRGTGSYANGIGLEIAARYATGRWLFVMHQDCMVTHEAWLPFMLSRIDDQVRGVAMSVDKTRVHAMHASGFLVDRELAVRESLSFMPHLPEYDVGDGITVGLRRLGRSYYVCANTFNRPDTVERIPPAHPLRELYCDRALDEDGNVIFAHLGRGTLKVAGQYARVGKADVATWLAAGRRILAL